MALTKIPSSLLDTSGGFDLQGNITLGDNEQIQLGDSTDLAIYHDGSNSYIKDTGTGNLFIDATSLRLRTGAGTENYLVAEGNGAVTLYHDNSPKIATSSAGATVTGTLTVTGDLDITGDINSYNVTDLDVTDQTITLGAGQTEANSGGSGIIIDGSSASILWNETNTQFDINKGITVDGTSKFTIGSGEEVDFYRSANANLKIALGSANAEISSAAQINFKPEGTSVSKYQLFSNTFYINGPSVGIGTNSPTKSLSVKAPSGSNGGIDVFHNNGNKVAELVHHGSGDEGRLSLYDGGTGTVQIHGETGQDSYINSGNVGIGTDSPAEKLDVQGDIKVGTGLKIATNTTSGNIGFNRDCDNGAAYTSGLQRFQINGPFSGSDFLDFQSYNSSGTYTGSFYLNAGKVGIGTSQPQMGLHVGSGTQSTSALPGIGIANGGSTYSFYSASDGTKQYIAGIDHNITYTKAGSLSNHSHAIVSNNTIRLFCKNDGFLGIGDVDPDSTVHIKNSTAGGPQIHMDDGTNSAFINFDGTSLQLSTQRDMVDGTWHNTAKSWGGINIVGGTGGSEITMTTATGPNTAPVTRCKLDQNGRFYFGGTAAFAHNTYGHSLIATGNSVPNGVVVMEDSDVSSGIGNCVLNLYFRDQDPATYAVYVDFRDGGGRVGSITHNDDGGGVTYNTTSDYRLKENVNYTWDALPLLTQLKPAKFNFIGKTDKTRQGFLAHEVMDIVPGSVKGNKDQMEPIGTITDNDGNVVDEGVYEHFCKTDEGQTWTQTGTEPLYQELDYSRLVPLLTKAIQELKTELDAAKARITELEG